MLIVCDGYVIKKQNKGTKNTSTKTYNFFLSMVQDMKSF